MLGGGASEGGCCTERDAVAPSGERVAGFAEMIEGLGLKVTFRLGLLGGSVEAGDWMRGVVSLGRLVEDMASRCADRNPRSTGNIRLDVYIFHFCGQRHQSWLIECLHPNFDVVRDVL